MRTLVLIVPYAVMTSVTVGALALLRRYRRPLEQATADLKRKIREYDARQADARQIAPLGEWASRMNVTVISNTGEDFTMSFVEFHASEEAKCRSWNKPRSVTLWSADDTFATALVEELGNDH